MRWQYQSYKPKKRKYYFSEFEIDFSSENFAYDQFLLQEYFNSDNEIRAQIGSFYKDKYGSRSFSYLDRKFIKWKNGEYHLTELMKERIVCIMPKFLNGEAKYKVGVLSFMASIKEIISNHLNSQNNSFKSSANIKGLHELIDIFENEFKRIKDITDWSFKYEVLSDEEKSDAIEIAKYILETRLQVSLEQIERDFSTFLPPIRRLKRGLFSASYQITEFKLSVDITNIRVNDFSLPKFKIKELASNSRYKVYADKYLAYEFVALNSKRNKAISDSYLNENDLRLFFDHYEQLSTGNTEVKMNSRFKGEGGILSIEVDMKPIKTLSHFLLISVIKVLFYIALLLCPILLSSFVSKYWYIIYYCGFCIVLFFWTLIKEEIIKIRNYSIEMIRYGK